VISYFQGKIKLKKNKLPRIIFEPNKEEVDDLLGYCMTRNFL
jgi:hypothetical protein